MFNGLIVLMVLIVCMLNRYGWIWTNFQLKPSILDSNRDVKVNWSTGVRDPSPRASGVVGNCTQNPRGRFIFFFLADVCFLLILF